MKRLLYLTSLAAVGALSLFAHDFWMEPSSYQTAVGTKVAICLRVGEHFRGDPLPRDPNRIVVFSHFAPTSETPVRGVAGIDPAGVIRLDGPGLHVVAYQSTSSFVELDAAEFEKYLHEEGLERIVDERNRRNERNANGRELFSRCVKSILRAGRSKGETGFDRLLNFPLELVPDVNPYGLEPGDEVSIRVFRQGKPLAGALVTAYADKEPSRPVRERANENGRVELHLNEAGPWLIKTVHMERISDHEEADWQSWWASLTFELSSD